MIIPRPIWYHKLEDFLAPSWPLMLAIAAIIIGVTVTLIYLGDPAMMALWLVYLVLP